eukprot:SAG31_NODE_11846_length_993_cov_0.892617_1_plen_80_part_10
MMMTVGAGAGAGAGAVAGSVRCAALRGATAGHGACAAVHDVVEPSHLRRTSTDAARGGSERGSDPVHTHDGRMMHRINAS